MDPYGLIWRGIYVGLGIGVNNDYMGLHERQASGGLVPSHNTQVVLACLRPVERPAGPSVAQAARRLDAWPERDPCRCKSAVDCAHLARAIGVLQLGKLGYIYIVQLYESVEMT